MSKQYKILIADDSIAIQKLVDEILKDNDENKYITYFANDGREACTIAYHELPDLILMDIKMPVWSGIDAIKKIKGNSLVKNIPIIIVSSTKQFQDAFYAGADDFLLKPFDPYELILRVQLNLKLAEKVAETKRQHELLKIQKQDAINQRDIIIQQKAELMEDLRYARFVQKAILPSNEILNSMFSQNFLYDHPKNIVSGDFYWVAKKNDSVILALADCTGHGMSGALMTMAGTTFLNEILAKTSEPNADQILNELRDKVIQILNQKGDIGEASNGMDIALIIYDKNKGTVQFSGANNPLYLIRNGGPLDIFKGDRMPIGFYFENNMPFTRTDIEIAPGDFIYLFTDGYADQFGGPMGKKFRYNQFRELIERASLLPSMDEQLELINNTMEEWIEGHEQVDDMMILGIRF